MIRLNESLARARRHRWLGLLVVIVLAFLLVMTVMHGTHDQAAPDAPSSCVAIVLAFFLVRLVLVLFRPEPLESRVVPRGPPRPDNVRKLAPPTPPGVALALPIRR